MESPYKESLKRRNIKMARIKLVEQNEATGAEKERYDELAGRNAVTNMKKGLLNDAATYGPSGLDFGLLYLWSSVDSLGSLLPPGWRVATRADFSNLFSEASNEAAKLKTPTMWDFSGTNNFSWNGVPSGHYSDYLGKYEGAYLNPNGALLGMDFWTSESASSSNAYDVYYRDGSTSFGQLRPKKHHGDESVGARNRQE